MPKYYDFKVAGYYLYFTSFCVVECMHVHASDSKFTEGGSAKFFVKSNGDSILQSRGLLNDREIAKITNFIKDKKCIFVGLNIAIKGIIKSSQLNSILTFNGYR